MGASFVAQRYRTRLPVQETRVQSLGWEGPLEEGMATHSSILARENPTDRGAWRATVHGVAKNRTQLHDQHFHWHFSFHVMTKSLKICRYQESFLLPAFLIFQNFSLFILAVLRVDFSLAALGRRGGHFSLLLLWWLLLLQSTGSRFAVSGDAAPAV